MEATAEITAAVKNVPALRFPEFEGEWVKKKLKDIFTINAGGDVPKENVSEQKTDKFKYPIYANAEKDKGFYAYSDIYKVDKDVVTVAGRGVNVGIAHARNHKFYPIVRLLVLTPKSNQNIYFFEYAINRLNILVESTGVPQLTAPQLSSYKVAYPIASEQQKIASFLSIVDDKVQQLSKKKELLEKYKKGVMQQIFSQQIRFKNDNGNDFPEWEEKMIKDIAPLQRGFDLPISEIKEGEFPVVFSNGILKSHSEYKTKGPGVVTGRSGTIGQVTFVEKDYWPHNTSLWVTNFCGNDPKYVFYFYQQFKLERFGTGSGVPTLNRNDVHVQKVYFPSYSEQVKIRDFFTVLDNKLNYTSKQLEQAQQFKKGLLQQLFV